MKRRNAVEPENNHLKRDHRMDRIRLKGGVEGSQIDSARVVKIEIMYHDFNKPEVIFADEDYGKIKDGKIAD